MAQSQSVNAQITKFLKSVKTTGEVWALQHEEGGWAICDSEQYEETLVYLFWSKEDAARAHCTGDWATYKPVSVDRDSFIDDWLVGMHKDEELVGLDWNQELEGEEMEPLELAELMERG